MIAVTAKTIDRLHPRSTDQ